MKLDEKEMRTASDPRFGELPRYGNLAFPYIAYQREGAPKYSADDSLTKGTLFPGLDLPFKNEANRSNPYAGTPLGEVMALDFVVKELNLYLDTHPDDMEALSMMKSFIEMANEAKERYIRLYGPICVTDSEKFENFKWICDPWPWEYNERTGRA